MSDDYNDIDISSLFRAYNDGAPKSLKELFELKVKEMGINQTRALETMQLESRALNAVLDGTSTRVDLLTLVKLAEFLDIDQNNVVNVYLKSLKRSNVEKISDIERRKFILQNFNISELKKEGIIESVSDFDEIDRKITSIFSYTTIYDYRKDVINSLYSSAKLHKENSMLDYWIEYSRQVFKKINNKYKFNKEELIKYFPTIRWHSMNHRQGLWEVVKALFKMGITIIYLPKFKTLHIRGATFLVNKKPCIVLTDYKGHYATLWFSLLHELHHILFDFDEVLDKSYHVTTNNPDLYIQEIEKMANKFARDYLFSDAKMEQIQPHINNLEYIKEFSLKSHIHYSVPYTFQAYDKGSGWTWIKKYAPLSLTIECLQPVENISLRIKVDDVADYYNKYIY